MSNMLIHILPAIGASLLIHLIIHEAGHLLGGLLTGWRFLHLQVNHIAVVRHMKGIRFKFLPSINYQCIMYPRTIETGARVYTMSGCWMNMLLAFLGLIGILFRCGDMVLWVYSWCFFVSGIGFYLMNGIPNTKRLCNDKACCRLLKMDSITRQCHNAQLIIAKCLGEGMTYKWIGEELICLSGDLADNDILAYQAVLEYYYHLETGNHERMIHALEMIDLKASISNEVMDIIALERLYSELVISIVNRMNKPIESKKYLNDINAYICKHKIGGDVHSFRVKATYDAYECAIRENPECSHRIIDKAITDLMQMPCLYKGEKIFCVNQLIKVKDSITSIII